MKNYQKLHYQNYYAQGADGEYVPVTKGECFATAEEPNTDNPFKQRWLYDFEAGYAVRLERSERGERLYRLSDTALKREERHGVWKTQCVFKDTDDCDQNCEACQRNVPSRTVELDKPYEGEDGDGRSFDIADETDVAEICEKEELHNAIRESIAMLTPERQEIIRLYFFENKTQREIAAVVGKDHRNVGRNLETVLKILKEKLKDF
jgi:RNA polymerase sigma factor (sigma-70 family)